eukprot:g14610.t1
MTPPPTTKTPSPKLSTTSSIQVTSHPQHPPSSFPNPTPPASISFPKSTNLTALIDCLRLVLPHRTYLESIFSPFFRQLPTYVCDTTHALHLLENFQFPGPQHLIFTMDVQSLYSSIPHAEGLKALRFFLFRRPGQSPSIHTIVRLAELVLTLNNFSFNSSHFLQTKGLAMGTCMGPKY